MDKDNSIKFYLFLASNPEKVEEEEKKEPDRPARLNEILRAAVQRNPVQRVATRPLTRDEIVSKSFNGNHIFFSL